MLAIAAPKYPTFQENTADLGVMYIFCIDYRAQIE